jgi:Anti-sigma factor NepR
MVDLNGKKQNSKKSKLLQNTAKPEVTDLIGQRLRSFYEEVASRPVPDRFRDLLKQLEEAEQDPKNKDIGSFD